MRAPEAMRDTRVDLAEEFLQGSGVEIGALHLAMRLPAGVQVRYVDRMTVEDLRSHYPELGDLDLAPVDIVDDGELLSSIDAESLNFIVANHFLEHCEDPIATIANHLTKLTPGGVLFYAVPDKRYTFDFRRPRTPLGHHIADHDHGPEISRSQHYLEWASLVHQGTGPPSPEQAQAYAHQLQAENYSIHFHVWTQADLIALMLHCHDTLDSFEIEAIRRRGHENIIVLRTHGEPPARDPWRPAWGAADPLPPAADRPPIPLAALRCRLDAAAERVTWPVGPDGANGRALLQETGTTLTFPLALDAPVTLTARAALLPHDWRDGRGTITAWVAVAGTDGAWREVWSGPLASAEDRGLPDGLHVACEVPADTRLLGLGIRGQAARDRAVARAIWVEPALGVPHAPRPQAATHGRRPAPGARSESAPALISVLTPVHDPPLAMLEEAIASVRGQTFAGWELCLVDDGCTDPRIVAALDRHADSDPRIRLTRRERAGGIADATNAALADATGIYVALLDHDDTLAPTALARIADRVTADPELDMVYTDEDIVLDGRAIWVHHKPGWSPDTLRTNGYTCHLGVYRRALVDEIGGLRTEFNGSQDVDMILRLIERTGRVGHVPEILYHWRAHADSTAGGDAKPYAYVAARRAIADHLAREGVDAAVDFAPPGLYRVVHRVAPATTVAIVVSVSDALGLGEAGPSWLSQMHARWQVVLTAPEGALPACIGTLQGAGLANHRITTLAAAPGATTAAALADAAATATADQFVLMQMPAVGLGADWLTRLIGYSAQPGIAAAGPVLQAPSGLIQDAGVALPRGIALPLLHGSRSSMNDHFGYGTSVYNVLGVSGVLATARDVYHRLGGLDPRRGELALLDYCLRAGDVGLRVVTVGDVRMQAAGHDVTINDLPALWRLRESPQRASRDDPFYSPSFLTDRGDFALPPAGG